LYSRPTGAGHPGFEMNPAIAYVFLNEYHWNKQNIVDFIKKLDHEFVPPLLVRGMNIDHYVEKIFRQGDAALALVQDQLVGLVTFYCNDLESRTAYLSWTGVDPDYRGRGISIRLISKCLEKCRNAGMQRLNVDTWDTHDQMIGIYQKHFHAKIVDREITPLRTVVHIQIEL